MAKNGRETISESTARSFIADALEKKLWCKIIVTCENGEIVYLERSEKFTDEEEAVKRSASS